MTRVPDKKIELPKPWYWTDQNLTPQLKIELSKDHVLYNAKATTIARREDNADVLFELESNKFAVVYLTWQTHTHLDSYWPATKIYDTWQDVFDNRIMTDAADFN